MRLCPSIWLTVAMTGCGGSNGDLVMTMDATSGSADMSAITYDMAMKVRMPIGSPCTVTSDCGEGKTPLCWARTVFNTVMQDPTPGGYCTSKCTSDNDCGSGFCANFVNDGMYCLASCTGPADCRADGYACFIGSLRFFTQTDGCFPSAQLDCDPTAPRGACTTAKTMKPGGCARAAYGPGKAGICKALCDIGVGNCPADSFGDNQLCIVDDERYTIRGVATGDGFVGPICLYLPDTPMAAVGADCLDPDGNHYYNDCVDDAECFLKGGSPAGMGFSAAGDNKCYSMCYLAGGGPAGDGGVAGACANGKTCKDIFGLANAASRQLKVGFCM